MTCRLDQTNPIDALYDRAKRYPGGIEALAHRLGMASGVLYKKLEHNNETHHLRQDEFETIIALCASSGVADAYRPLRALCWRFEHVAVRIPVLSAENNSQIAQQMVRVFAEAGDVARDIERALANDGVIDARELARLEKDIEEAFASIVLLRDRIRIGARASLKAVKS